MEIIFNNQKEKCTEPVSLEELMKQKGMFEKTGIAVAVNLKVQSKNEWNNLEIKEGDSIIVISATAGG